MDAAETERLLLMAGVMIRQLELCRESDALPGSYRMDGLGLIEKAAGLTVGTDGDAAFAMVGSNLQDGRAEFVPLSDFADEHHAKAAAATRLWESFCKTPTPKGA